MMMSVPQASCVVLLNAAGEVLLVRENYGGYRWGFPGGRVDPGETPASAAVREAEEEAGVAVSLTGLLTTVEWEDAGEPWLASVFGGVIVTGDPRVQDVGEIAELGWFPVADLPSPLTRTAGAWAAGSRSTGDGG